MELNEWAFIGAFFMLAWMLPTAPIIINKLLAPNRPTPIKRETYECGVETVGDTWVQFKVQYYLLALVFLVFDVEMVLLFPWAVAYNDLGMFAFLAGGVFILLLLEGLAYAWRKGALEWT
ncbi:MAG: NADH-quinone oxidoreductase subunit A [Anaerolineae bacterium]|nr:NADH-quinone oxidoreductase subunit A [Anaerolineae bacterium]